MIIVGSTPCAEDHPLAGAAERERAESRWRALGQVLANIAKRKCNDQPSQGVDLSPPMLMTTKQGLAHQCN